MVNRTIRCWLAVMAPVHVGIAVMRLLPAMWWTDNAWLGVSVAAVWLAVVLDSLRRDFKRQPPISPRVRLVGLYAAPLILLATIRCVIVADGWEFPAVRRELSPPPAYLDSFPPYFQTLEGSLPGEPARSPNRLLIVIHSLLKRLASEWGMFIANTIKATPAWAYLAFVWVVIARNPLWENKP